MPAGPNALAHTQSRYDEPLARSIISPSST